MSKTFSVHQAKTHLSRLIELACAGEEVIITRGKTPVVKLSPIRSGTTSRRFGAMKGRARVDAKFFEPLPDEELAAWEK
jgi:antitoxin (DNA-binding transcriptional repressor) of toxin-antitoxin stability system